jgi:hypothetical protein
MYAIKKGNLYVKAEKGQKTPYTSNADKAALYATYEEALKDSCVENERVVEMRRVVTYTDKP